MSRAEPLPPPTTGKLAGEPCAVEDLPAPAPNGNLRDCVAAAVRNYLEELDGQMSTDVYQMVLSQVEAPLLEEIMAYTHDNQTRASLMLGLNRGTLRKKLKQYNLIPDKE